MPIICKTKKHGHLNLLNLKAEMMQRTDKSKPDQASTKPQHHSDRLLWLVWMGLMVLAVISLPFVVRQSELVRALADMCMTALGAG